VRRINQATFAMPFVQFQFIRIIAPTLDNLRNLSLMPTTEMLDSSSSCEKRSSANARLSLAAHNLRPVELSILKFRFEASGNDGQSVASRGAGQLTPREESRRFQ
jgi:hypothetical protein